MENKPDSELVYRQLMNYSDTFDYTYHTDKIKDQLRNALKEIIGINRLTMIERLKQTITWEGIIFVLAMLGLLIFMMTLVLSGGGGNSNYDKCIFEAINRLESSADILSLCKEFKN